MTKIHFAHANGFPMGSYRVMLSRLAESFDLQGVSHIGHDERWPVDQNWDALVDEQLNMIHQCSEPVWGVGHSLGGVLLYRAALKAPGYFKGLILLDPPLYISGIRPWLLKLAKRTGKIDTVTPARQSRRRKSRWSDRQAVFDYLISRKLFADFDERCLWDYIDHATDKVSGEYRLNFMPEVEYEIFCNLADNLWNTGSKLKPPVTVVTSREASVIHKAGIRGIRQAGLNWRETDGGHLFPLEHPESTADMIQSMINSFTNGSDGGKVCTTQSRSTLSSIM